MKWFNVFTAEALFVGMALLLLGYLKLPDFLRKRKLAKGSPWGYYPDQVIKADPGFFPERDKDFLHNTNADFAGIKGFGDYGEFTGFGEMGEF
jgi:hypothetical protein